MKEQEYRKHLYENFTAIGLKNICVEHEIVTPKKALKGELVELIISNIEYNQISIKRKNELKVTDKVEVNINNEVRKKSDYSLLRTILFITSFIGLTGFYFLYEIFLPKPYGEVKGWPNSYFGPLIEHSIDQNTKVVFNGKNYLLSEGFCLQNDNSGECKINIKSTKPNLLGKSKVKMSADFVCNDGVICGNIKQNKWIVDKNTKLKYKYDDFGVELFDGDDNTIFQMDYDLEKNQINLYGLFHNEGDELLVSGNSYGRLMGQEVYIYSATMGMLATPSLRPIFYHNTVGPRGERIPYYFESIFDIIKEGNALFIVDESTVEDNLKIKEIVESLNKDLIQHNIKIRSYLEERNKKLGNTSEEVAEKLVEIGHHRKSHFKYIVAVSKLSDTSYVTMILKTGYNDVARINFDTKINSYINDGLISESSLISLKGSFNNLIPNL